MENVFVLFLIDTMQGEKRGTQPRGIHPFHMCSLLHCRCHSLYFQWALIRFCSWPNELFLSWSNFRFRKPWCHFFFFWRAWPFYVSIVAMSATGETLTVSCTWRSLPGRAPEQEEVIPRVHHELQEKLLLLNERPSFIKMNVMLKNLNSRDSGRI